MEECVFCKIANKEIKSYKIYSGKEFMAIMDIFPPTFDNKITMPTVLIITKQHYGSNVFEDAPEKIFLKAIKLTRKIARAMQLALKPERVCLMTEGTEINHFHIKLYALYKEYYPGYLSSMKGPDNKATQADKKWLKQTAKKIRIALKEIKKLEKEKKKN
ncbi:MAG: HIT family protein [Candidatus Woesearchaeota archaeon]